MHGHECVDAHACAGVHMYAESMAHMTMSFSRHGPLAFCETGSLIALELSMNLSVG